MHKVTTTGLLSENEEAYKFVDLTRKTPEDREYRNCDIPRSTKKVIVVNSMKIDVGREITKGMHPQMHPTRQHPKALTSSGAWLDSTPRARSSWSRRMPPSAFRGVSVHVPRTRAWESSSNVRCLLCRAYIGASSAQTTTNQKRAHEAQEDFDDQFGATPTAAVAPEPTAPTYLCRTSYARRTIEHCHTAHPQ